VPNPSQGDADDDGVGDFCDPDAVALSCGFAPLPDSACRLAASGAERKSQLQIKDRSPDTKDQLKWKWNKGEAVTTADFGDPDVSTNTMSLCIYDARGLHRQLDLPAGGVVPTCSGRPCWKTTGTKGFKYKDRLGDPDGITAARFKSGDAGKSQVQIKAKGDNLFPPLTDDLSGVVIQLLIDDGVDVECFKTSFDDAGISKQDAAQFKVKGPQ
jgi:hypothetical protein